MADMKLGVAVDRSSGPTRSARLPVFLDQLVERYARENEYVDDAGTIHWGVALRMLIAAGIDHVNGTGGAEQLRAAYYNGFMLGWMRTRDRVITSLNDDDD